MAETKNLPTNLLPPTLCGQFIRIMGGKAVSLKEAERLSTLPLPALKREIVTKQLKLGDLLTQTECDAGLAMLALAGLPRASAGGQGGAVRALYLELLREAGVTGAMFISACKRFIMQEPPPGKSKFFPDPGQLATMCAEDAADRKQSLAALTGAMALLEAPQPAPETECIDVTRGRETKQRLEGLFRSKRAATPQRANSAPSPRGPTAAELRGQLAQDRDPAAVERLRNLTKTAEQG